jgi:hypothetical protein
VFGGGPILHPVGFVIEFLSRILEDLPDDVETERAILAGPSFEQQADLALLLGQIRDAASS